MLSHWASYSELYLAHEVFCFIKRLFTSLHVPNNKLNKVIQNQHCLQQMLLMWCNARIETASYAVVWLQSTLAWVKPFCLEKWEHTGSISGTKSEKGQSMSTKVCSLLIVHNVFWMQPPAWAKNAYLIDESLRTFFRLMLWNWLLGCNIHTKPGNRKWCNMPVQYKLWCIFNLSLYTILNIYYIVSKLL